MLAAAAAATAAVVLNILTARRNCGRLGWVEMAATDGAAKLSTVERVVKSE